MQVDRPATAAELPQIHAWQRALREYLRSLTTTDFLIATTTWEIHDRSPNEEQEKLYRDWVVLTSGSRLPPNIQFHAAPEEFTLPRIERDDGTYCFQNPAGMAWWTQLDVPGNPFYRNRGAQRRALVVAIIDMVMLESCWQDPRNLNPSFHSANLGTWAYTYLHCKDLLRTCLWLRPMPLRQQVGPSSKPPP
jgi:hypothetical protein